MPTPPFPPTHIFLVPFIKVAGAGWGFAIVYNTITIPHFFFFFFFGGGGGGRVCVEGGGGRRKCSFHHHSFDPIDCTMAGWYGGCGCQLFETLTTLTGRPSLHSPPLPSPPLPSPFHSCPPFPPRGWPDPSLSSLLPPTELSCFPCKQVTSLLKKRGRGRYLCCRY